MRVLVLLAALCATPAQAGAISETLFQLGLISEAELNFHRYNHWKETCKRPWGELSVVIPLHGDVYEVIEGTPWSPESCIAPLSYDPVGKPIIREDVEVRTHGPHSAAYRMTGAPLRSSCGWVRPIWHPPIELDEGTYYTSAVHVREWCVSPPPYPTEWTIARPS